MISPSIPEDLLFAKKVVYDRHDLTFGKISIANESTDYGACTFILAEKKIVFRTSKTTPTKIGQFVTVWKRNQQGLTAPFEFTDPFDFVIISSRNKENLGQFIFPKAILLAKGIISDSQKEGKRGIRVYPPWDKAINKQAQKTQQWQLDYFLRIDHGDHIAADQLNLLISAR